MKYIDVEQMSCASEEEYVKNYSKGEYCHQQSFSWGFQEGCEFAEKEVEMRIIEKTCEWMRKQMCQEYSGGPLERVIPDFVITDYKKTMGE